MKLNFTFLRPWRFCLVFALLLTAAGASAQCPEGDVFIGNQQDLDNYAAQYPNCTQIAGNLIVYGSTVTNLNALGNITTVNDLYIQENANLTSLQGLNNLSQINGSVYITDNSSLTSLQALFGITSISGVLSVSSNNSLQSLQGLNNLQSVYSTFYISNNYALNSLSALSSLNYADGFSLYGCQSLTSLAGLSALTSVYTLDIQNNMGLVSLAGMTNLNTVNVFACVNNSVTSLAGLENIDEIIESIYITNNAQLTSLNGIQNVDLENCLVIYMVNNGALSVCNMPNICSFIGNPDKFKVIEGNLGNCANVESLSSTCDPRTKISPDFCGATVASSATAVYAVALQGATQYRFRISDGDTEQTIDKPSSAKYFRFNELGQYRYNIEYFVDVSAYINGSWTPYGDACTLTTPSTQIKPNQCGSTVATLTTGIYATPLPGTIMYRFRVTTPNTEFTIDKPTPVFTIADVPLHQYATTYTVDVAASVTEGIFGQYGPSCLVTSPAMPSPVIKASQCGSEVAFGSYIYADPFTNATGYRFSVTSSYGSQVLEKSVRYFSLNELSAYGYNADYAIQVSAFVNGQWTGYGPSCTVHTASNLPVTRLKQEYCNRTYPVFGLSLYAVIVPGATVYRFRVTNGAQVQILDRPANSMKLNMLSSYAYYTNYSIDVAVMIGGVWSDYGDTCNVNVIPKYVGPPARSTSSQDAKEGSMEISLAAYPNPSSDVFRLELGTQSEAIVTIQVYDLTGKLLDAMEASPEELSSKTFGDRYSAGIYNVIVTQDDYKKTLKLVKK